MEIQVILKALSDGTRLKIIEMLLHKNYCVRAISRRLEISESAVSQHIKILKENGLLVGKKFGYFVHYDVNRDVLHQLAQEIEDLANVERKFNVSTECGCNCNKKDKCNKE
ncbi:ArsR/SmtB family transcription factor [Haloimpatiens sp. FM7330]|uniref:ArsR/SmtB family transcription factor n=1 Tax=Haloimpatiens sp. FM7330 TaxID=3298610 RepID=UPI003633B2F5